MGYPFNHHAAGTTGPLVVEIIGPAGAGKSTLFTALSQRRGDIRPAPYPSRLRQLPYRLGNTWALLPTFLRYYWHSRWFTRREIRSMVYLRAWLHALEKPTPNPGIVTIFDHGPIYRLAYLRALGPEITSSEVYQKWWRTLLDRWSRVLDVIVWLDAPNPILLERIRARDSWHMVKDRSQEEAYAFLDHYRCFLEQTIAQAMNGRQVLLRFDTSQQEVAQMADTILHTFDALGQPCGMTMDLGQAGGPLRGTDSTYRF